MKIQEWALAYLVFPQFHFIHLDWLQNMPNSRRQRSLLWSCMFQPNTGQQNHPTDIEAGMDINLSKSHAGRNYSWLMQLITQN